MDYPQGSYIDLTLRYGEENSWAILPKGVHYQLDSKSLRINLDQIESNVFSINDPHGGCEVTIEGVGHGDEPILLLSYARGASTPIKLNWSTNNHRPFILYAVNTVVDLNGNTCSGSIFIDTDSALTGNGTISGTLAFDAGHPVALENLRVIQNSLIKQQVAPYIPQACAVKVQILN